MTDKSPPQKGAFSINAWCTYREISRSSYYKLRANGKAPRLHFVGNKPLISVEADADWLREREAEAALEAR